MNSQLQCPKCGGDRFVFVSSEEKIPGTFVNVYRCSYKECGAQLIVEGSTNRASVGCVELDEDEKVRTLV